MDTQTAFSLFEENCVRPRFAASLKEAEQAFQEGKDSFRERLLGDMELACRQKAALEPDGEAAYMDWELLRTNLLLGRDVYRIMLYGRDWFLSPGIKAGETDVSLIMGIFHELVRQLTEDAKRYIDKIPPVMVEAHTAYLLPPFHEYVKELVRYAIADATELEAFVTLKKAEEFQIRVGECLEPGYLVYTQKREKDRDGILKWLMRNESGAYCFQDFQGLDLSTQDLTVHDLRNADLRDAVLEGTGLSLCILTETEFRRCRLKGARLSGSILNGADFTEADMRQAHMEGTLIYDGRIPMEPGRLSGYAEAKFTGADLRGAVFRECIYCGADFSGADIRGADFTGASLFRCRFSRDQLGQAEFTDEQRGQLLPVR